MYDTHAARARRDRAVIASTHWHGGAASALACLQEGVERGCCTALYTLGDRLAPRSRQSARLVNFELHSGTALCY